MTEGRLRDSQTLLWNVCDVKVGSEDLTLLVSGSSPAIRIPFEQITGIDEVTPANGDPFLEISQPDGSTWDLSVDPLTEEVLIAALSTYGQGCDAADDDFVSSEKELTTEEDKKSQSNGDQPSVEAVSRVRPLFECSFCDERFPTLNARAAHHRSAHAHQPIAATSSVARPSNRSAANASSASGAPVLGIISLIAIVLMLALGLIDSCGGGGRTPDRDPSATVPGFDYGDLGEDFEYCKDVGRTYEAQGSGSAEQGYNACLDALDRIDGG